LFLLKGVLPMSEVKIVGCSVDTLVLNVCYADKQFFDKSNGRTTLESLSRVLCKYFFSLREPASKFNGKAIESRLPVVDRHGPFLGDVLDRQIDHLKDRLIGGENPMMACHLA